MRVMSSLLVVLLSAACVVRVPVGVDYSEEAGDQAPPPPRAEVVTVAPSPSHVWIAGRWAWRGRSWVWMPGSWVAARQHHVWVPGHWVRRGHRYVWVDGRWRRR